MSSLIVPEQRVGDHQGRAREIVRAHVRMDAPLEIAVARKHRHRHQLVVLDRLGDRLGERPRIADAGRAAIADQLEAERVEILLQPRLREILAHHLGAGRERCLDPRLRLQPASRAPSAPPAPRPSSPHGFEVLVQLVIAAITTSPCADLVSSAPSTLTRLPTSFAGTPRRFRQLDVERRRRASTAAPGPAAGAARRAKARRLRDRVPATSVKTRLRRRLVAPHPLRLGIRLDQRDPVRVARR